MMTLKSSSVNYLKLCSRDFAFSWNMERVGNLGVIEFKFLIGWSMQFISNAPQCQANTSFDFDKQ